MRQRNDIPGDDLLHRPMRRAIREAMATLAGVGLLACGATLLGGAGAMTEAAEMVTLLTAAAGLAAAGLACLRQPL